jgi:hypothetical protein
MDILYFLIFFAHDFFLTKYFFSSDVNLPNFIAREHNKKRLEEWEGAEEEEEKKKYLEEPTKVLVRWWPRNKHKKLLCEL